MDTFVIEGVSPDQPDHGPIEVYLKREGAEAFLLNGLLGAFAAGVQQQKLQPGGTISLIVQLGLPTEADPFPFSSGSFILNNPDERRVWDYTVVPYDSKVKPRG